MAQFSVISTGSPPLLKYRMGDVLPPMWSAKAEDNLWVKTTDLGTPSQNETLMHVACIFHH